jgi:hypothetical protein
LEVRWCEGRSDELRFEHMNRSKSETRSEAKIYDVQCRRAQQVDLSVLTPLLVYARHRSFADRMNLLDDNAKFKGLGDLSLLGLPINSLEWNDLSTEKIVNDIALKRTENGLAAVQTWR